MEQRTCNSVLVVDDDPATRNMLALLMQSEGYVTSTAHNGADALEYLRESGQRPCVILLDLNMPIMTGWEFRLEQKRDPELASIPIAIISADRSLQQQPFSIDAIAYFQKPLDIDDLLALVNRCCGDQPHTAPPE